MSEPATHHTSPADCAQLPTFKQIQTTLTRLDASGERTAVALEKIAEQGAMVANHEKRLDGQDKRLDRHELHFAEVFNRVTALELHQAKDEGAEAVVVEKKKFWSAVKLQLISQFTPPLLATLFFLLWLADRFSVFTHLAALFKEFK